MRLKVLMMVYHWVQEGLVFQQNPEVQQNQEVLGVQWALEAQCFLVLQRKDSQSQEYNSNNHSV